MAYLNHAKLDALGLKSYGNDVKISEWARIYNPNQISIGNNVRIDDFCILSAGDGGLELGSHIHIAAYTSIIGKSLVKLGNYCNISSRVSIYSSSDDYSGEYLTSPVVSDLFTNVTHSPVMIGSHCIIGAGTVILPGSNLGLGVAVGAMSLINGELLALNIYAGIPAKLIKPRSKNFLNHELEHKDFYEYKKNNN